MQCTSAAHFKIVVGGSRKPESCLELQGSRIKNFNMLCSAYETKGRGLIGLDTLFPATLGLVLPPKWNGNILMRMFIEREVNPDSVHSIPLKIRQKSQNHQTSHGIVKGLFSLKKVKENRFENLKFT